MVQEARSALDRSADLVKEALESNPDRTESDVATLPEAVKTKLIDRPQDHGAVCSAPDAEALGLPVVRMDPRSDQWREIWLLWAKCFELDAYVAEGRVASQVIKRRRGP